MASSYQIAVSESQRLALLAALHARKLQADADGIPDPLDDADMPVFATLLAMFDELPFLEPGDEPGKILHGFCL